MQALSRTEKSLGVAAISGLIAGCANYYYNIQQTVEQKKENEEKPLVQKKYTKEQALKRSVIAGFFVVGCAGLGAYQLISEPNVLSGVVPGNEVEKRIKGKAIRKSVQNIGKDDVVDKPVDGDIENAVAGLKQQYAVNINGITPEEARINKLRKISPLAKKRIEAFTDNLVVPYESDNVVVYEKTAPVVCSSELEKEYTVVNADTLDYARVMIKQGLNPAVLDMANEFSPGGGPDHGCTAQEEQICYRSNLFAPLYFARKLVPTKKHYHEKAFITPQGAIYIPGILVTKASEAEGYKNLPQDQQYHVAIIASAACDLRPGSLGAEYANNPEYINLMKEKIRAQLRIAIEHGHDSLLLSAFGCGAFVNDPAVVAPMYRQVFDEAEFAKAPFKSVVFAIYTVRDGKSANIDQFKKAFDLP